MRDFNTIYKEYQEEKREEMEYSDPTLAAYLALREQIQRYGKISARSWAQRKGGYSSSDIRIAEDHSDTTLARGRSRRRRIAEAKARRPAHIVAWEDQARERTKRIELLRLAGELGATVSWPLPDQRKLNNPAFVVRSAELQKKLAANPFTAHEDARRMGGRSIDKHGFAVD